MPEPQVAVVPVTDEAQRAAAFAIRVEVFVEEQHVPVELESDDRDETADHVLLMIDGLPAGTARLVVEPPGYEGTDPALGPVAHLGRIAVRRVHRGAGHGAALVRALEADAVKRGLRVAYLSGQVVAVPFYERLGYTAYGEVFDDAGIDHRHMSRPLA